MPRTRSRSSASASRACARASATIAFAAAGSRVDPLLRPPEVDRQGHEALLGAVVEVALDPAQLRRLELERRGSAAPEPLHVLAQGRRRVDAQQPLHDRPVQDHQPARDDGRRRHEHEADQEREQEDAGLGLRHAGHQLRRPDRADDPVDQRRREQRERREPEADGHDELEDPERQQDQDVDDVAPAVRVEELRLGPGPEPRAVRRARPAVERLVGVGDERTRVDEGHAPPLHAGEQPADLDAEGDDRDADQPDQQRPAGGEADAERGHRQDRDPETDDDRDRRQPRRRLEWRPEEGAQQVGRSRDGRGRVLEAGRPAHRRDPITGTGTRGDARRHRGRAGDRGTDERRIGRGPAFRPGVT